MSVRAKVGLIPYKLTQAVGGSGVSAAVLLLGLAALGHTANTLYDGSWSEWGSRDDTPIVT